MSTIKNISTLIFGKGINLIINIIFMPYLARALSVTDYGTYGQTLMTVDIIKTLFSGGLAIIIFVYLSSAINKKEVISSNFFLSILLGVAGYVLTIIFSNQLGILFNNNHLPLYISIYGVSVLFAIPNTILFSLLIFYKKIRSYTKIIIFINLLRLIFLLVSIQIFKLIDCCFYFICHIRNNPIYHITFLVKSKSVLISFYIPNRNKTIKNGLLYKFSQFARFSNINYRQCDD